MPSIMMSHVVCRLKERGTVPYARRPQGGCAGDATSSSVKYFLCAHHQQGAIALQKCTNCELIFEIECSRIQIQKKDYVHTLNMKIYEKYIIIIEQNVIFTRARAADMSSKFLFYCCVYNTLVFRFTKWFLWNFVQEKNYNEKYWKYAIFRIFLKMTEIQNFG